MNSSYASRYQSYSLEPIWYRENTIPSYFLPNHEQTARSNDPTDFVRINDLPIQCLNTHAGLIQVGKPFIWHRTDPTPIHGKVCESRKLIFPIFINLTVIHIVIVISQSGMSMSPSCLAPETLEVQNLSLSQVSVSEKL